MNNGCVESSEVVGLMIVLAVRMVKCCLFWVVTISVLVMLAFGMVIFMLVRALLFACSVGVLGLFVLFLFYIVTVLWFLSFGCSSDAV